MVAALSMSAALRHLVVGSGVVAVRLSPARSLSTSTWRLAQDQTRDTQLIAVDEKLEELANSQSKWTTIEGGIQYLRELAMLEVIYNNLDVDQASEDLDQIQCMRSMWRKADPLSNMVLTFSTKEDATAFAEKNGWSYEVEEKKIPKPKSRSYGANFSWNKRTRVSTK
ncbi:NADH dehydrogenase [ubiquinone] iron-sulfur protein 4, mitochondrial-like [Gymnogyps californianus]|uniref:NADH dehydrogenase [ubiquinone] iron-sulfur protein 4, mitochondrial-like n=1 Tax=Gymnogyps californianus TaxID=33616 RepID=UPI0021C6EEE6|nr:NADH dehydrogenase [ubiquinone] iron-sulfur protein 4, mitochondrial-like [Gymnogyps californianus]